MRRRAAGRGGCGHRAEPGRDAKDARTVISNDQDLINDPDLGDKHLTATLSSATRSSSTGRATGVDPTKIDPASRQGRLAARDDGRDRRK